MKSDFIETQKLIKMNQNLLQTNRKETQVVLTLDQAKLIHELIDIEIDALMVDPINSPDIKALVAIKTRILSSFQMGEKLYFKLTRRQIGKITSYIKIPQDPYIRESEIQ